ncbi:hypothetical protein PSEUBRA_002453 [Kalmanozyma brasiliensis GHG001]|uniref:uncharacterized protein n=1 Tax=Kalmanozyma brasiliensis (strain GHG001) TaxID=1365824 RepID=UPI001CE967DF|nr:uncharacterized protein PSEUBRA_002453 [Kalmanozyma brasiliensis GHG001]EST08056.2 hypothetical protein PSEUBRA_002453 [Kalmanozyma brasiliensis GHG001]
MEIRRAGQTKSMPTIVARDISLQVEESASARTRIDDTDPGIAFSPGTSPYVDQEKSSWVVVQDDAARNGSAVMSSKPDAQLTFTFPGDSLAIGMLYKAAGASAKLTLEDGKTYALVITAAEAAASAPNGDKEALQKKTFHLEGFACTNHTATLSVDPISDGKTGDANPAPIYFDGASFPSADSPDACTPSTTSVDPDSTANASGITDSDSSSLTDHTSEYAGIGAGAAILGFITALFAILLYRRHKRRKAAPIDPPDHSYRTERGEASLDKLEMPFSTMQHPATLNLETEPVFRPRGIHALAQDESFSSVQTSIPPSFADSPSKHTIFPLMPFSSAEHIEKIDDGGDDRGKSLLDVKSDPPMARREHRRSDSKLQYEKRRVLLASLSQGNLKDSASPAFVGQEAIERMPQDSSTPRSLSVSRAKATKVVSSAKSPHRPNTASAVDRIKAEARQLDIRRTLSPFERSRPATASSPAPSQPHHDEPNVTTISVVAIPVNDRFRRKSTGSDDTDWSRASVNESALDTEKGNMSSNGQLEMIKVDKTTDSEAEMWISKRVKRRNSTSGVTPPKRPPKSPYRPSTGGGRPKTVSYANPAAH